MDLIALLLALWLTRIAPADADWRGPSLFRRYADVIAGRLGEGGQWSTPVAVLVLLVPPLLLVALLQLLLVHRLAGLPYLALSVAVLVICLPAMRADHVLRRAARAWEREDGDGVRAAIHELDPAGEPAAEDDAGLPGQLVATALRRGHDALFGLMFWFVVLGPFGAVGWRMAGLARRLVRRHGAGDGQPDGLLDTWYHRLGWIPAKLTVLSYAVVGNFSDTLSAWRESAAAGEGNNALLERTGTAAVNLSLSGDREDVAEQLREARRFFRRTLLLWLAVLAALTIAGVA